MSDHGRRWSRRDFLQRGSLAGAGLIVGCGRFGPPRPPAELPSVTRVAPVMAPALAGLKPILRELVEQLERELPYAAALVLRHRGLSIDVDDRAQSVDERPPAAGAVFTVFNGLFFEEAATSDLRPEALRAAARRLMSSARARAGGHEIDAGRPGDRQFETACQRDPEAMPLQERFQAIVDLQGRARAIDSGLVACRASYGETIEDGLFVNRARALSQRVIRVRGSITYVASDGSQSASDWVTTGGTGGFERCQLDDDRLAELAQETRDLLEADQVEPADYTVVVDGSTAGTVAHESFGHGVELDMFVKDRALAEQFVGKRVGSELVNIHDDPSLPGGFGSYFFDHEGQAASPTHVVRDGVFERGISDLMSATELGVERSANGRRQDFSRKTYARMSNTFFGRGDATVEELIGGVSRGYLLQKLTHGMEDPKGWGIMLGCRLGREIRDGQLSGKIVAPVGITGYVPDVLGSVDGVASDFVTRPGGCGKGHKEYVPVSTGGPHIRFRARLS